MEGTGVMRGDDDVGATTGTRAWGKGLGGHGKWITLVALEVLAHSRVGEMVAERRGAYKQYLGIEGDQATVEGFVV